MWCRGMFEGMERCCLTECFQLRKISPYVVSLTKGYSVLDYACYRAGNGFAHTEEVVLFLEAKKPALPSYGAPCSLGARIIGVH